MDEEAIYALISEITIQEFQDEKEIFQIEGKALISDALSGEQVAQPQNLDEFEFGSAEMLAGLKIVSTITATVKAILEIREKLSSGDKIEKENDEYSIQWKERLIEEGLDSELAEKIARQFSKEMISLSEARKKSE